MKREELNDYYYYEDTVMTPANHLHRVYHADEVDHLLDENDAEIESLKATHDTEMMDAGMRERRLRRALWLARALRARDIQRWWIAATCAPITERACSVWNNVERKCQAKAEEYK